MKNISLVLLVFGLFSCETVSEKDIYLGKLEELIIEDFSIKKDSLTKSIHNIRVVKDEKNEFIVTTASALQFKGWSFIFRSTQTGEEVYRIEIPNEGPNSMKGGIWVNYLDSPEKLLIVSSVGEIGEYDKNGVKKVVNTTLKSYREEKVYFPISNSKEIANLINAKFQLSLNPNHAVNWKELPGPGEMRSEFPLDFREWIIAVDLETGEIEKSDFSIPTGYEQFKYDLTSTRLFGDWDKKRNLFYLVWPGSPEIYLLDGIELKKKLVPMTSQDFNYLPTETIPWGDNFTVWALPKEASRNIFLIYDEHRDLILKCAKINESGAGETKFERTKHYVLSVYTGDWRPLGEYLFDFESELDLENWFLTSQGLFINKPEQKSEDEYEFYKIDLRRFAN
ncbi:hypothetical protein [Algoriphagus hitonicola]|uniref:TolB-like 6-blade propeller-like n=1 Tax=Algoriphagus hitonicola TaxID=435880 RepID=A0A1I2XQ92_9BACT|nr:hypothetical protein [Algoriphagus hitonicola]SFH14241.1 hypothetical protein SAMN04487988_12026 [Algoriphagus hitonicola]